MIIWWLILLTLAVLYLLWKVIQILNWLKIFYDDVLAQFKACGCTSDPGWPPPEPPQFP